MFTGNKGYRRILLFLGLVILVGSIGMLTWSFWPLRDKEISLTLSPDKLQTLNPDSQIPAFLFKEDCKLIIEYPAVARQGDPGSIVLTWEVGNSPPNSASNSSSVTGPSVLVESRLDLLGFVQTPSGSIDAPLLEGQTIALRWQIIPVEAGIFSGTIWSYLSLSSTLDNNSTDQSSQGQFQPVAAQDIKIQVISLFGLDVTAVKWLGIVGIMIAFSLGMVAVFYRPKPKRRAYKKIRR